MRISDVSQRSPLLGLKEVSPLQWWRAEKAFKLIKNEKIHMAVNKNIPSPVAWCYLILPFLSTRLLYGFVNQKDEKASSCVRQRSSANTLKGKARFSYGILNRLCISLSLHGEYRDAAYKWLRLDMPRTLDISIWRRNNTFFGSHFTRLQSFFVDRASDSYIGLVMKLWWLACDD